MRSKLHRFGLLLACACTSLTAYAATPPVVAASSEAAPTEAQRMQWFADAKFGIFIHYGIYAVDGID